MIDNQQINALPRTPQGSPSATTASRGIDLDLIYGMANRNRVLIIDDDPDMVGLLKEILRSAGFDVVGALGCNEALKKCTDFPPSLIMLDLMMPEIDGWQTYNSLREVTSAPVIVVSAITNKESVVNGLQIGADDYVTKPFFNAEVIARVNSVLRRAKSAEMPARYAFPDYDLIINLDTKEVSIRNNPVHLTSREFAVLVALAKRAPRSVSYETITKEVWGEDSANARKRIKYLVYLLRRKLEKDPRNPTLIINSEVSGYKLNTKLN